MQTVPDLLRKYNETDDNDVKYMLLRDDIVITDIYNDIPRLIDELYKPILLSDANGELSDLITGSILPELVLTNIDTINNNQVRDCNFFNRFIVENLIQGNDDRVLFALKNILKKLIEKNCALVNYHNNSYLILEMLDKISLENSILFLETLNVLVKFIFQFNKNEVIPSNMLNSIITLLFIDDKRRRLFNEKQSTSTVIEEIILQIFKHATKEDNISFYKLIRSENNYRLLSVITKNWYKYNINVENNIFKETILQGFEDYINSACEKREKKNIADILTVLENLHSYFDTNIVEMSDSETDEHITCNYNGNRKYISHDTIASIYNGLAQVKKLETECLMQHDANMDDVVMTIGDELDDEIDEQQQAYLDELDTDDGENEDDDVNEVEERQCDEQHQMSKMIIEKIASIQETIDKTTRMHPIDTTELKESLAKNINDLEELEMILDGIIRETTNENNAYTDTLVKMAEIYETICGNNKQYIKILKIGNLKQSIDESYGIKLKILNHVMYTSHSYEMEEHSPDANRCSIEMRWLHNILQHNFKIKPKLLTNNDNDENTSDIIKDENVLNAIELNTRSMKIIKQLLLKNEYDYEYKDKLKCLNEQWFTKLIRNSIEDKMNKLNDLLKVDIQEVANESITNKELFTTKLISDVLELLTIVV
ncbi:hypothetical protein TPHA_0A02270 [Tetrapisispora phaffii CBS 4417]|uniref:Uncharacterized protein n=1 Tax=Tetrapisispora phaffii (strain ATCC 24235 / CBS 4417 / NBRC 1672 / NRRL Y-8282 / UCD 70-5) TaxID=1071381 RepID=G8BN31_TETPH|nr:hypothetical protein TPHA_0A02270 [Tetrapisispora phaffii CBS 4417]CCE61309.1 hypothetical protein TPHA_0A02270 [Tetrapisispora phaffii CBS 4417]